MTAQDIDLVSFTADDTKRLREKIDGLNVDPAVQVCSPFFFYKCSVVVNL